MQRRGYHFDEAILVVGRDSFSQLLKRPGGGGMSGGVEVNDPARSYLHEHEDVKHAKAGPHGGEEITGDDPFRLVSKERGPTLIGGSAART